MNAASDVQNLIRDPDIAAVEIKITVIAEQEAQVPETVRAHDLVRGRGARVLHPVMTVGGRT